MKAEEITALQTALGHRFRRPALLEQALTHSSHAHETEARSASTGVRDNEQLEFLGDAVLGFVTSQELFQRFPEYQEGQLSKLRAHLVSAKHLVQVAEELQLGRYLRLGRGEEKSGGRAKHALLVNTLEAVLAAIYLDAGMEKVRELILAKVLDPELERLGEPSGAGFAVTDHKSALQEFLQATGRPQPLLHRRPGAGTGAQEDFHHRTAGSQRQRQWQAAAGEPRPRTRPRRRPSNGQRKKRWSSCERWISRPHGPQDPA